MGVNLGSSRETKIRVSGQELYPDLVLTATGEARRLHAIVEVETSESVNQLEAMAQWARFAKARGAFFLYVPSGFADVAQRLCQDLNIKVAEIWVYSLVGDLTRFSMVYRSAAATRAALKRKPLGASEKSVTKKASRKEGRTKVARKAAKKTMVAKRAKKKATKSKAAVRLKTTAAKKRKTASKTKTPKKNKVPTKRRG